MIILVLLNTKVLTASTDHTIRLWDSRQSTANAVGTLEGKQTLSVEWGCGDDVSSNFIVVTERSGKVSVHDRRTISSNRSAVNSVGSPVGRSAVPVHVFDQLPIVVDCAIFSPNGGEYLIGGITQRGEGMADLGIWKWENNDKVMDTGEQPDFISRYPAHAGPIYSMDLSPDGKRLATGGSDAVVGLWDTDDMVCTHTFTEPAKLVRSVAFSHDGLILAMSNEENDIFLAEAESGISLGCISLGHRRGGAEEVAWHPTAPILACARTEHFMSDRPPPPPIAVAKLNVASSLQQ